MTPRLKTPPRIPVVERLAAFAHDLRYEDIPEAVVQGTRSALLDSLGVAVLGLSTPQARMLLDEVRSWGGVEEATVLGTRYRVPMASAGLVGGLLCHSNDFDDTHLSSITHPSACVVPATLASAEVAGKSGRDAIANAVVGYELMTRIGRAASGQFQIRGFHATAICGGLAAAAVTARTFGGSKEAIAHAIGCSASMASGILEPANDGTWTKLLQTGWAVHSGLVAGRLGARGFVAPRRALDGKFGLYPAMVEDDVDYDNLTAGLGEEWETLNISAKLYPTCHHIQAFLDGAVELVTKHRIAAGDIEAVELVVGQPQARVICEPWSDKIAPNSDYAARFSLPYAIAAALVDGTSTADQFVASRIGDRAIKAMMERISYAVVPNPDFPRRLGGELTLRLRSGESFQVRKANCKGAVGAAPIAPDDIETKFRTNAGVRLGAARAGRLMDFLASFETETVRDLFGHLQAPAN